MLENMIQKKPNWHLLTVNGCCGAKSAIHLSALIHMDLQFLESTMGGVGWARVGQTGFYLVKGGSDRITSSSCCYRNKPVPFIMTDFEQKVGWSPLDPSKFLSQVDDPKPPILMRE